MAVVADLLALEKARLWRGVARSTVTLASIILLFAAAFAGLVFIILGGYLSLAPTMAPWQAGAIVGGGVLLLVLIILSIVIWIVDRQGRKPVHSPFSGMGGASSRGALRHNPASSFIGTAVHEMFEKSSIKARDVAISALVAGLVLGASPRLRERLFSLRKLR